MLKNKHRIRKAQIIDAEKIVKVWPEHDDLKAQN